MDQLNSFFKTVRFLNWDLLLQTVSFNPFAQVLFHPLLFGNIREQKRNKNENRTRTNIFLGLANKNRTRTKILFDI